MLVTQTRVVAGGDEKWSDAEQILKAEPETCTRPSDEGCEGRGGLASIGVRRVVSMELPSSDSEGCEQRTWGQEANYEIRNSGLDMQFETSDTQVEL